ncbi:arad-like aldolase/epimerase [Sodiomyces alkalinus F11]|uniref:Arad-like aldolase/epimerase n=1 Tax=Sodiomyces alkalinus (strain CBS 110278 / VKM F-3762 / F11) TaxID=1314773 RepID=A0A3N2PJ71_SODAK|nr:arad-like aldolase/epimerase [Sodiomyces alkalinus F11]ROT34587.1 arad-like aldolase/epimerase [Sodiomyces alkalinus F11]
MKVQDNLIRGQKGPDGFNRNEKGIKYLIEIRQTAIEAISHGSVPLQGIPTHPSFAAHRTWLLSHMAAAFRHWDRMGYVEGFSGHISVRDPEHPNAFWTNPLGRHFGLLRASDMILVDLDGNVIGGNRSRPPNKAGFLIHSSVHRARPDAHAVCHAHTVHGKAWSVFARRLDMITQDACKFYADAHAVYDRYGGVVLGPEEGDLIAAALGPRGKGCILRNHGLLTVGRTVDEAAWLFTSMEKSCQVQLLVESVAHSIPKVLIPDKEAKFNFDVEADPEFCYCEFQVYYDQEEHLSNGDFKN